MKITTKTRYGTRLLLDLALHHEQAAVQISEISNRQNISVKYLEQLIRPLKKAGLVDRYKRAQRRPLSDRRP